MSRRPKNSRGPRDLSVREKAYLHIQQLISTGKLESGSSISELLLAKELGSSRTPIREAMNQLVAEGLLEPGMNGGMDIIINRIPNAISIPSKALFTRNGKPVVFLAHRGHYTAAEVTVQARNPDEVAVTGIPAGSSVALVDPDKKDQKK